MSELRSNEMKNAGDLWARAWCVKHQHGGSQYATVCAREIPPLSGNSYNFADLRNHLPSRRVYRILPTRRTEPLSVFRLLVRENYAPRVVDDRTQAARIERRRHVGRRP